MLHNYYYDYCIDCVFPYSAVNSCPVSPNSGYRHRVPSFDFKAMAKYASTLLSSQEQAGSDNEVTIILIAWIVV